jgi:hypothetical protein
LIATNEPPNRAANRTNDPTVRYRAGTDSREGTYTLKLGAEDGKGRREAVSRTLPGVSGVVDPDEYRGGGTETSPR